VDEAGRGPVIGPMVICGVLAEKAGIEKLKELNVRDSKTLTRKSREKIGKQIVSIVKNFYLIVVSSQEVDKWVTKRQLNKPLPSNSLFRCSYEKHVKIQNACRKAS